jgi:hypothetical protein
MDNTPDIIPESGMEEYSERDWGSMTWTVSEDDIEELKDGKIFACFGGEYTTYIRYDPDA